MQKIQDSQTIFIYLFMFCFQVTFGGKVDYQLRKVALESNRSGLNPSSAYLLSTDNPGKQSLLILLSLLFSLTKGSAKRERMFSKEHHLPEGKSSKARLLLLKVLPHHTQSFDVVYCIPFLAQSVFYIIMTFTCTSTGPIGYQESLNPLSSSDILLRSDISFIFFLQAIFSKFLGYW